VQEEVKHEVILIIEAQLLAPSHDGRKSLTALRNRHKSGLATSQQAPLFQPPSHITSNTATNASAIALPPSTDPVTTLMARRRRPPRPGALTELPPLKILTQIVLLQAIWYLAATALILFTALVAGKKFSFDLVLNWRSLRGDTTVGWMLGLVWLLNSVIGFVSFSIFSLFLVLDYQERG
jgi:hypothetical protein